MEQPTITQIDAMTGPEAQDLAAKLATEICGTDRFKTDLAARIGVTRPAVNSWFAKDGRPPALVILYLGAELERRALAQIIQGIGAAMKAIQLYS